VKVGSYGVSFLVHSDYVPPVYVLVAASYGPGSPYNVAGFGNTPTRPITDCDSSQATGRTTRFWNRLQRVAVRLGFGIGEPPWRFR
jgi:hypothetical protein